jgi:hypothetical protein
MSFTRGLLIALLGTGAVALLALWQPQLVLMGLYLLVLPGLYLMFAPSVFGYLLGFTVGYLALARLHRVAGVIAGLAIVGAAAVGIPAAANLVTDARLAEARARDLAPAAPVAAAATIAIVQPVGLSQYTRPGEREAEGPPMGPVPGSMIVCDDLCLTLLYNGVASRVIMVASETDNYRRGPAPVAYRLEQGSRCAAPALPWWARWIEDAHGSLSGLKQAVRQRLAAGECLLAEPAAETTAEVTVKRADEVIGATPGRLSLAPGEVRLNAVEVWQGARLVARASEASPNRIGIPLLLLPYGEATGWEIERGPTGWSFSMSRPTPWTAMAVLRGLTGWSLSPPQADPGGAGTETRDTALRRLIDAALADPGRPADDSAFALVPDLLAAMGDMDRRKGLEPGDVARLARLVEDARVTVTYWRLPAWKMSAADAAVPALRDAMLRRLLRKADPEATLRSLSQAATFLPAGLFAAPNELLDRVIADGTLKEFGLVTRLADRGAEVADQLVEIVRATYTTPRGGFYARAGLDAMIGLCRLGTKASAKLPVLEQMAASRPVPPHIQRGGSWQLMLFALGADPARWEPNDRKHMLRDRERGCRRD